MSTSNNDNDTNNNSEIINISTTEESSSSSIEEDDDKVSSSSESSDSVEDVSLTSFALVPRTKLDIETRLSWGRHNINAGRLRELPMIAIDKFYGDDVLKANLFFLTHLHTDHMVGLEFSPFLYRLEQPGVKLYTSSATPLLFPVFNGSGYLGGSEKIQQLIRQEKIIPLDVNEKIELDYLVLTKNNDYEQHKKVYVTMIPAGHCPGSVMLLFEYDDTERILYTGDFRLSSEEIKNLSACRYQNEAEYLHDYPNSNQKPKDEYKSKLKKITHLYLDTTFCTTKYLYNGSSSSTSSSFVSRDNAIENILPKIKEHLKHKGHLIRLEFSARVSHEYAIIQFNKLLKQKTHVSPELYNIYSEIDSCINSMTLDSKAVIHLCNRHAACLDGKKILTIKFSAMWFTMGNGKSTIRERGSYINVCYSMHASMKEMGTMISAFDTKLVTPLVLPRDMPRNQIEEVLRSVTNHNFEYKDYEDSPIIDDNEEAEAEIQISKVDCHLKTIGFSPTSKPIISVPVINDLLESSNNSQPRKRRKICWNRDRTPPPSKL